jgi:hypothetical protein
MITPSEYKSAFCTASQTGGSPGAEYSGARKNAAPPRISLRGVLKSQDSPISCQIKLNIFEHEKNHQKEMAW